MLTCALALTAAVASADVPDPANCQTSIDGPARGLLIPDGLGDVAAASFTVTVRNAANGAINNAVVQILVGGLTTNHTIICAGQTLTANTNVSGVVSFNVGGGGCYKGANAFVIQANGVEIRNFSEVMSPDYAATDDSGIPARWSRTVSAVDFGQFAQAYQGGTGPSSCHDYNNDNTVNPPDFSVFSASYKGGTNFCNP
jgi:hypothetical protein